MIMTRFVLNGRPVEFSGDEQMPLLWYLRDHAGLTGTKFGCGVGLCGACTVHLDGQAARSCSLPLAAIGGRKVTTIEGFGGASLHAVQRAWIEEDVAQCGYCQAGQIMAAAALLAEHPCAGCGTEVWPARRRRQHQCQRRLAAPAAGRRTGALDAGAGRCQRVAGGPGAAHDTRRRGAASGLPQSRLRRAPRRGGAVDAAIRGRRPEESQGLSHHRSPDAHRRCDGDRHRLRPVRLDATLPGALVAVVERCPYFSGGLASYDATATRAVPGVREGVVLPARRLASR
jgi:isoquinoline 1-oxidoreductase subunit alpha